MRILRNILLLSLCFFVLNCHNTGEPLRYGFFYDDMEVQTIDLDTLRILDMRKLFDQITQYRCEGKCAVLKFTGKQGTKELSIYNDCEPLGCSNINNVFFIVNDEILKNRTIFSLRELEEQLSLDYRNNGSIEGYSENPALLIVRLKYTSEDTQGLINLLDRITEVHSNLGIEKELLLTVVSPSNYEDLHWR